MDRLQSIETFVRVAQTQSFAEAARQLRVAKSVVTTRIKQLEEHVGAPLFHRSTRMVRLSEAGQALLADCIDLVGHASDIIDRMREVRHTPSGILRLQSIGSLVLSHFDTLLHAFQRKYPDIHVELHVSDVVVDPIQAGVDCALQIFPAASAELVARPLFPVRRVFCASPAYLQDEGTPMRPQDLHLHPLGLYSGYATRDHWVFHGAGEAVTLTLHAALSTNNVHILREYALRDSGIVCLPTFVAGEDILEGRLQVVLADWALSSFQLSLVYPTTSRNAFKLKLFVEHALAAFGNRPHWDASLIERGLMRDRLIFE